MKNSRTKNSVLNILTSSLGTIVSLLISFLSRVVFLHYLNATYLGVNGLFSNIVLIFSLVELGIGAGLTQMFYKPLADNDVEQLSKVTRTTKLILHGVGILIIILTIIFTPLLNLFVNDVNAVEHMRLIFFIFGINSSITYFLGYYRTIITANQQAYKLVKIDIGWKVLVFAFKALVLALTKNFIMYLIIEVVLNFLQNVVIKYYVKKQMPQIDYKCKEVVSKQELKALTKNVAGLSLNKVASIVTDGTDNIIISKFLDLVVVGLSSNYVMIRQSLNGVVEAIFGPLLASIGNICVSEDEETKHTHFNNLSFAAFWIYGFLTSTAFVLADSFIQFAFGDKYLIPTAATFFICFDLFCVGTYRVASLFRTAQGLFWYGKFRSLFQALVNLVVSLVLVYWTRQLWAVFAGTVASRVFVTVWYEPLIVFKHSFYKKPWKYYLKLLSYYIVNLAAMGAAYYVVNLLPFEGIVKFIVGGIICTILINGIFALIYFRTAEFKHWFLFVISFLKRIKERKQQRR